jgi:hypothetical protein
MSELDRVCRLLVTVLHDQIRADIPDIKIFGRRLLPSPWSKERINKVADLVAEAIRTGIAESQEFGLDRRLAG